MAKYVEFVGVHGVGKTATYTQLKCSKSSFNYYHNFRKNPYSIKGAVNNKIQSLRKKFHSRPRLSTKPEDLLGRFLQKNHELADKFWEVVLLGQEGKKPKGTG